MDKKKLGRVIGFLLVNQTMVTLPCSFVYGTLSVWRGCLTDAASIPEMHVIILQIAFFVLVEEVMFYYGHRSVNVESTHREGCVWTMQVLY